MAPTAAPPPVRPSGTLYDREVEIETPEHVAIGYELADLGSRFSALLLDGLILVGGALLVGWGIPSLVRRLGGLPEWAEGSGVAILLALGFLWFWGYFVYFEGMRDGQTPGKRAMGIRAVADGGYPLTVRGAAIRNLIRLVDLQPAGTWLLGGLVMMVNSSTKRLGDLAAGSIVVRERTGAVLPEEAAVEGAVTGVPRLNDREWAALSQYVARRATLAPDARTRIAWQMQHHLDDRFRDHPRRQVTSPDEFLLLVHQEESSRRASAGLTGRAGTGQATVLVRRQKGAWERYRALLELAQKSGLDRLPEGEVSRFAALYREVAADLARARTYGGSPELLYALERSVGAGHNLLYRPTGGSWRALYGWLAVGFPALFRKRWKPIAVATACFYLPALVAYAAARAEPDAVRDFVGPVMMERVENAAKREAQGVGYAEEEYGKIPLMPQSAVSLIANNVGVTFYTFAGGVLAGLGSLFILLTNGVLLGSVAGLFANHGVSMHLWGFVLPHGVLELTAICIAGGAGLWLGSAMILPGRQTRRHALVTRSREAVSLLAGAGMLLVFAGFVEGFVSPSPDIPREAKLAMAALNGVLMLTYLLFSGRGAAGRRAADRAAER
ncbi:MAG TPA: stage II sporulation protein M [Longimicrobiaceae bacterium]|nr:stage II sporulation protein M [Longimicrobiaceae bacterium]